MPVHWTRTAVHCFGESETGRGEAATPGPLRLVRGARWRRPAGGALLRELTSLRYGVLKNAGTLILGHASKAIGW